MSSQNDPGGMQAALDYFETLMMTLMARSQEQGFASLAQFGEVLTAIGKVFRSQREAIEEIDREWRALATTIREAAAENSEMSRAFREALESGTVIFTDGPPPA